MAKKEPNKGGRPRIEIDFEPGGEVEKLCALQCTGEEIAAFVGVNYDTLNSRVKELVAHTDDEGEETLYGGFSDYYDQ